MTTTRRQFLNTAWAMAAAAPAYGVLASCTSNGEGAMASGQLKKDPQGLLDLPEGFTYQRMSETGMTMTDGFLVPARHDGMGAFAVEGNADLCVLIRNHENNKGHADVGPFGKNVGVPEGVPREAIFDIAPNGDPVAGGTTTLIYNTRTRQLEQDFLSMVGTERNCAGGITPWGSWITCEESRTVPGSEASQYHGYAFEVPATARGLVPAKPLRAMGRFNREAVSVDPRTSIVYQTEDSSDGLLYRFIPNVPGDLSQGGKLQALALLDQASADTRNWDASTMKAGQSMAVRWIDLDDPDAMESSLQERGFALGAAKFARGEGIAWAIEPSGSSTYFACTNGGPVKGGQIWRYIPSEFEGTAQESEAPGQLILHYESPDRSEMDMCDNLVASPWGHLIICEDGADGDFIRGVAPDGRVYAIAYSPHSETAGACFSPDGEIMFVNIQKPGITVAITGPWASIAVA